MRFSGVFCRRVLCWLMVAVAGALSGVAVSADGGFHRYWPDNLFAVDFIDELHGYVAGESGTVLRTSDGGRHWDATYIGHAELIRRIDFVDANNGWAVGHRGSIFHTSDAGNHWEPQYQVPNTYLRDVSFADASNGWVVGHGGGIWHTSDGGKRWEKQNLRGYVGRDLPRLHGVHAIDAQRAVAVGEFGVIAHTEDGGATWLLTPNKKKITWLAIDGTAEEMVVVGLDGNAIRLRPADPEELSGIIASIEKARMRLEKRARAKAKRKGREYVPPKPLPPRTFEYVVEKLKTGTREHLFDVRVLPDGEGVVVGRATVLHLTSSGLFEPMKAAENVPLSFSWYGGVDIVPTGEFWAPGLRGMVLKGDLKKKSYGLGFNLPTATNVTLISSRWDKQ